MPAILERIRPASVRHYRRIRRHRDCSSQDIPLTVSPIYDWRGQYQ